MKSKCISLLLPFFALCFAPGCVDDSSQADSQTKVNMLTRSWHGEEFFIITVGDSSFRRKDYVQELSFASDGSYFLYKISMSSFGKAGDWTLEDNGDSLRLTDDAAYSEVFFLRELSPITLVLGDTNTRGYALMPSQP